MMDYRLEKAIKDNDYDLPETLVEDIETLSNLDWRKMRQLGVGGSEAAAVYVGEDKFKSVFDVQISKITELEDEEPDPETQFRFDYGHMVESLLLKYYGRTQNAEVFVDRGMYRRGNSICDGDGFAVVEGNEVIGLEFKSTSPHNRKKWKSGVYGQGGEIGNMGYYAQVQHYMYVLGLKRYDIVCDFEQGQPQDIVIVTVYRDNDYIDAMIKAENEFWENRFEVKLPESVTKRNVETTVKKVVEIQVDTDGLIDGSCKEFMAVKAKIKKLQDKIDVLEEQANAQEVILKAALAQKETDVLMSKNGKFKVTLKTTNRTSYDTKELKKHPEFDVYKKTSTSTKFDVTEVNK